MYACWWSKPFTVGEPILIDISLAAPPLFSRFGDKVDSPSVPEVVG